MSLNRSNYVSVILISVFFVTLEMTFGDMDEGKLVMHINQLSYIFIIETDKILLKEVILNSI